MTLTTYRVRVRLMLAQGYNTATETYVTAENMTQARYMVEAQYGREAFVGFCD
jgi:hypothetical protein